MKRIFDLRAHDGSRQFAALPTSESWYAARDHIKKLSGAKLTNFLCDGVVEAWIDFTYRDHRFSINNQFGEYYFFVADPSCPDEILLEVLLHYEKLLQTKAEQNHWGEPRAAMNVRGKFEAVLAPRKTRPTRGFWLPVVAQFRR